MRFFTSLLEKESDYVTRITCHALPLTTVKQYIYYTFCIAHEMMTWKTLKHMVNVNILNWKKSEISVEHLSVK